MGSAAVAPFSSVAATAPQSPRNTVTALAPRVTRVRRNLTGPPFGFSVIVASVLLVAIVLVFAVVLVLVVLALTGLRVVFSLSVTIVACRATTPCKDSHCWRRLGSRKGDPRARRHWLGWRRHGRGWRRRRGCHAGRRIHRRRLWDLGARPCRCRCLATARLRTV